MPNGLDPHLRDQVAALLPLAIEEAMGRYLDFLTEKVSNVEKTKDYQAYVKACKDAFSHIEHLLKLANAVRAGDKNDSIPAIDMEQAYRDFEAYHLSREREDD